MTERIYSAKSFSDLPESGVEAQKIRALLSAYGTEYDFCRFFRHDGGYLAALDGSFVIYADDRTDVTELAEFLKIHGWSDIFCSEEIAKALCSGISAAYTLVYRMNYSGCFGTGTLPQECSPSEVWDIIGSRFAIEFEPWYLDMSHRVRHGVSRCYSSGDSALVVQHEIGGEALISQVCTRQGCEGRGSASGLLREVCGGLSARAYVLCEHSLCGFYEKCGFESAAQKYAAITK